jgi:hypothetical protein
MTTVSKPFPPEISDRDRIITEGIQRLRTQHKSDVESHRRAFETRAEQEWERSERRRRDAFISKFTDDHYVRPRYKYSDLSPHGQYRVSLTSDQRLDGLAAVKLYGEMLYCFLVRNTTANKATIDDVKGWFRPYLRDVDGDYKIVSQRGSTDRMRAVTDVPTANYIIHAKDISRALADILTDTSMVSVEFGKVRWVAPEDVNVEEY